MPYAIIFTPEAENNLQNIAHADPLLASRILDEAERLAQDPTGLSSPGAVPFLLQQRYSFWFDPEEKKIRAIFSFNMVRMNNRFGSLGLAW